MEDDKAILPKALKSRLDKSEDLILLDVRTKEEHELAKIKGSKLIQLDELPKRLKELDKNKEIIVYCHLGQRSKGAAEMLRKHGFKAKNLVGGIDVWSRFIDKSVPQY